MAIVVTAIIHLLIPVLPPSGRAGKTAREDLVFHSTLHPHGWRQIFPLTPFLQALFNRRYCYSQVGQACPSICLPTLFVDTLAEWVCEPLATKGHKSCSGPRVTQELVTASRRTNLWVVQKSRKEVPPSIPAVLNP